MLSHPYGKASKVYYCWMGIFLASLAILLVGICEAKGILSAGKQASCNAPIAQFATKANRADIGNMVTFSSDVWRIWERIKG
jgi:hypothetical protein